MNFVGIVWGFIEYNDGCKGDGAWVCGGAYWKCYKFGL